MTPSRLLGGLAAVAGLAASGLLAQEVYYGDADHWDDLVSHPDQWDYVRQHADGFYVNFIELNWGRPERLKATADLFSRKNAYLESDMRPQQPGGETPEQADRRFLGLLRQAGFAVSYSSLNYGWSAERAANLPRPCLVQVGPWDMEGQWGFSNADRRAQFEQAGGISTDGPLGLWAIDRGRMRENTLDLIRYAHAHGKKAAVMICPYGAKVPSYDLSEFLKIGEDEVRFCEEAGALPDVWALFAYATEFSSVPEQAGGEAANTTSGLAYWLLRHLHDPGHDARIVPDPASPGDGNYVVENRSGWLDLAPVLRVRRKGMADDVPVTVSLDGQDITAAATGEAGFAFLGPQRLWAGARHRLQVRVGGAPAPGSVELDLAPNVALPHEVDQSLAFPSAAPTPPLTVYALMETRVPEDALRAELDDLVAQFGPGNAWHRPGVAIIQQKLDETERLAALCRERGLSLGLIINYQTHTGGKEQLDWFARDLRSLQWRMKGNAWQGYFTGSNNTGKLEIAEDPRDHQVPSPSRYAALTQEFYASHVRSRSRDIAQVMRDYPGVVTCLNVAIEEELAVATAVIQGPEADDYLADYSPFAVAEFRDWLRHTGIYDDATGTFAGQGAPETITGPFIEIGGKLRSPFYDDPDPDSDNGTGQSFNVTFGTHFTRWSLAYWDPVLFPEPITDPAFHPMPGAGEKGHGDGGFDAPRQRGHSRWWHAWSWDYGDENKTYPPGNPAHPAFGFRQAEVAHFVRDLADAMAAEGLPRDITYAHQIPGEQVGPARCRSSASPVWTGYLPANGTVGVTCFGWFDPKWATQYTSLTPDDHGWGIFEWHPRPGSTRDDPRLYDAAMRELLTYSRTGCRHLFAGWWNLKRKDADPKQTFWLNDSRFAAAIKDFMTSTPDDPPPMPLDENDGKIR